MDSGLNNALIRFTYITAAIMLLVGVYVGTKTYIEFNPQPKDQPSLMVSGTGKAVGIPDIATMSFSVVEQGDTVAAVTAATNTSMNNIVATMKGAGIKDADIKTTSYNLNPRYDYTRKSSGEIIGYELTQGVTVKVRNLDGVGEIVDAATQAGANNVSSPVFAIDDPETVKTEARAEAFAKAKTRAEDLAKAAGVTLGDIVTFSENDGEVAPQPYYNAYLSADSMAEKSVGAAIAPGSQEVNVTVNVTYAIHN